jgi:lipid A 4'-phosphatase
MNDTPAPVPRTVWIASLAAVLVFVIVPAIDLELSALFFRPGDGFWMRGTWYERLVYHSVALLIWAVSLGLVGAWLLGRLTRRIRPRVSGRKLAFLLLLLALGPGLIVNLGMKEHWGRSRPADLVDFGGDKAFTPAFVLSDQGGRSFPSGHAAAAFYLAAVAFAVARRKRLWIRLALEYGVVVGIMRIAAGGHFLSDVVTSFLIDLILFFLLYRLFFGQPPSLDREPLTGVNP